MVTLVEGMLMFTPFWKQDPDAPQSAVQEFVCFGPEVICKFFLTYGPMPQNHTFWPYVSSVDQALHTDTFGLSAIIDDVIR